MHKLLLQLDSSRLPSVFDRVVAYDGGADEVMSYGSVAEADGGERARGLVFKRFGGTVRAIAMPDATEAIRACERAELILNAGPAGVMLVPKQAWANRPGGGSRSSRT